MVSPYEKYAFPIDGNVSTCNTAGHNRDGLVVHNN